MNSILNIKNLSIGYTSKKQELIIAKDINVQLNQPKFIAILGKNGIGKSTLLRTISKVQLALGGEIFIDNKNITTYNSVELSKKISVVLTERIPPSNLTVYELIALGRQVYTNWIGTLTGYDKSMIDKAIDQVKINNLKNQKVDELSDGQYQKVMIARALAQDTSLILLDEPTAHLDIVNKAEVFKLLKELVKTQQKTILISSHELQLAIQLADDLWLMSDKEFVSGTKKELIANDRLQNLFESKIISFNKETNQFIFH
jgi:iron complex transport system ATP-binding protein